MTAFVDYTGKRFGQLTVIECVGRRGKKNDRVWLCQCDCGQQTEVRGSNIHQIRSCGCLRIKSITKHGMSKTRVFNIWKHMIDRCYGLYQDEGRLKNYRGKVAICDRWRYSFENFYSDMGEPPSLKHSIDRIDTYGHYEPNNCRWALQITQANNTKKNVWIEYLGETKTVSQWAKHFNLKRYILEHRLKKYPIEEAFARAFEYRQGGAS